MIEKTIVAWDGSAPARAALAWAVRWSSGGELVIVRVLDESIGITDFFVADSAAEAAGNALVDVAEQLRAAHPGLQVATEFVRGDPIGELRRRSAADRLVVVGTHRREGSRLRFEWSVGARLAASARGPVAVIPEDDGAGRAGVVVGVDGSAASDAAMMFAAEYAHRTRQPLSLIHAWQEPAPWQGPELPDGPPSEAFLRSLEAVHQQILDEALGAVDGGLARPSRAGQVGAWPGGVGPARGRARGRSTHRRQPRRAGSRTAAPGFGEPLPDPEHRVADDRGQRSIRSLRPRPSTLPSEAP